MVDKCLDAAAPGGTLSPLTDLWVLAPIGLRGTSRLIEKGP